MNRKYLNSTLLILLIVIWGAVFYKYFGDNKRSSESINTINPLAFNEQHYLVIKDTFLLKLTDRDPFKVSRDIKKKPTKPSAKKNKRVVKPIIKKNMVWPTITYHGFVKGESRNTRLILLKIANKLYRKREKETVNDIVLEKAYKDSLIVSLNNNSKTIIKTR